MSVEFNRHYRGLAPACKSSAARNSALAGHIPPGLIPFLASPNADIIQHRLTVCDTIVVLAGGRHCCIGLGGVGFAPSNEDLAFRDGACHLMNLFLRTMFKLRQRPVQFLGLFLATEQEEFFLKRPRFWNHFGSFFWAGNSTR